MLPVVSIFPSFSLLVCNSLEMQLLFGDAWILLLFWCSVAISFTYGLPHSREAGSQVKVLLLLRYLDDFESDNWLLYYLVSSALCWYVGLVSKVAKEIFNEPRREYVAISGLWYFFSFLFFSFLNIHSHKHWKAGCCILENFSFSHFKSPCSPSKFLDCYRNLNVEKKVLEMEL